MGRLDGYMRYFNVQLVLARYEVTFRSNKDEVVKWKSDTYRNHHVKWCGQALWLILSFSKTDVTSHLCLINARQNTIYVKYVSI